MKCLCIDLGTYSIKSVLGELERKNFSIIDAHTTVLNHEWKADFKEPELPSIPDNEEEAEQALSLEEKKAIKIQEFIKLFDEIFRTAHDVIEYYRNTYQFDGKVLINLSDAMLTTRFLELPVTQKKKLEQMIPFQLESSLPFSLNDSHFALDVTKLKQSSKAIIYIAKLNQFDRFYGQMQLHEIGAATLAPMMSFYQSALQNAPLDEGHSLFVDFGYRSTKAYHVIDNTIVSNHQSLSAGEGLEEFLISVLNQDASYVREIIETQLTLRMSDGEEPNQLQKLLLQYFFPLIKEIRRWVTSHKVKHASGLDRIIITGGLSKIDGIQKFLQQQLNVPVVFAETKSFNFHGQIELDHDFYNCALMIDSLVNKAHVANFLHGQYQSNFQQNIPVTSSAFVLTRVAMLSVLICLFLVIENFVLLSPKLKKVTKQARNMGKASTIGLTKTDLSRMRRKPENVNRLIKKKVTLLKKDYEQLQKASSKSDIEGLFQFNSLIGKNDKVSIVEFITTDSKSRVLLRAEEEKEIVRMQNYLNYSGLKELSVNRTDKNLRVEFKL
ncbi:MAG: hypothetical protein ACPGJV_11055 [Bacteriovoracaceae bacterium]